MSQAHLVLLLFVGSNFEMKQNSDSFQTPVTTKETYILNSKGKNLNTATVFKIEPKSFVGAFNQPQQFVVTLQRPELWR